MTSDDFWLTMFIVSLPRKHYTLNELKIYLQNMVNGVFIMSAEDDSRIIDMKLTFEKNDKQITLLCKPREISDTSVVDLYWRIVCSEGFCKLFSVDSPYYFYNPINSEPISERKIDINIITMNDNSILLFTPFSIPEGMLLIKVKASKLKLL